MSIVESQPTYGIHYYEVKVCIVHFIYLYTVYINILNNRLRQFNYVSVVDM